MSTGLGVELQHGIYIGPWTNWSKGKVLGATVTLTQQNGALLIAFIALFTTFVGTRFWRILCFTLYSIRWRRGREDGLYHQTQTVLRNSDNGTSAFWSWVSILWHWRRNAVRSPWRVGPLIILALASTSLFAVAGIFSTRIATFAGSEVLISGENCGISERDFADNIRITLAIHSRRAGTSANYAQNCYSNSTQLGGCSLFVKRRLPISITRNASCPFDNEICHSQNKNIVLDSGLIDSHSDLGLNTPPEERHKFRTVFHCAPLVTSGHTSSYNYSGNGTDALYTRYHYGIRPGRGYDYAFEHSVKPLQQYKFENFTGSDPDYTIDRVSSYAIDGKWDNRSVLQPIASLFRPDADLNLFFLASNNIIYTDQIDDPLYAAHDLAGTVKSKSPYQDNSASSSRYRADEPVGVLGCANFMQVCVPRPAETPLSSKCSDLGTVGDIFSFMDTASGYEQRYERNDFNRTNWIWGTMIQWLELAGVTSTLGAASLTSRSNLYQGTSGPLSSNQWQMDVEYWFSIALASLQGAAVETATGIAGRGAENSLYRPKNDVARKLCQSQKILSTVHTNFSILGLTITFVIGTFIILLSYSLNFFDSHLRRYFRLDQSRALAWATDGTFQLQRLAYEEAGYGNWTNCADDIPITEKGELLGVLDFTDVTHPRIQVCGHSVRKVEQSSKGDSTTVSVQQNSESGNEITNDSFSDHQLVLEDQPIDDVESVQQQQPGIPDSQTSDARIVNHQDFGFQPADSTSSVSRDSDYHGEPDDSRVSAQHVSMPVGLDSAGCAEQK